MIKAPHLYFLWYFCISKIDATLTRLAIRFYCEGNDRTWCSLLLNAWHWSGRSDSLTAAIAISATWETLWDLFWTDCKKCGENGGEVSPATHVLYFPPFLLFYSMPHLRAQGGSQPSAELTARRSVAVLRRVVASLPLTRTIQQFSEWNTQLWIQACCVSARWLVVVVCFSGCLSRWKERRRGGCAAGWCCCCTCRSKLPSLCRNAANLLL